MPYLIKALTKSAIKNNEKKNKKQNQQKQKKNKIQYLNLKAPSKNLKMQSYKTLATQTYFFLTTQQIGFFFNGTR